MKKTMKFLSMAALALVGATFTGCSSDSDGVASAPQQPATNTSNVEILTTTVSLGDADATRALAADGKKTFAAGETMALIYKNKSGNTVKAVSAPLAAGDYGQSATFTFELTDPDKSEDVTYIYPAAMANDDGTVNYSALSSQDGTLATLGSSFDLATSAATPWNEGNLPAVTLANQLAILAVTLKNDANSSDITSSTTKLTVSDGTNTYTVNRSVGAGPIYVAIRPTTSATIDITATSGTKSYTKTLTSKTYTASNGYPVSWRMTEKPDFLSGVFSVSSTKKVKFSKGNLRYASGTWSFFDNQYDYYTSYSADAWDKFGWSTSATTYGMNTSTDKSTYSGSFVDWGSNSDLQTALGTGWFTLSSAESTYLFNTRSASTVGGTSKGRYAKAKVNDVQGVILFPDTYTHPDGVTAPTNVNTNNASFDSNTYTMADWTKMESAGCVFLPGAGYRDGESLVSTGIFGAYWSATSSGKVSDYSAYDFVYYYSGYLAPAFTNTRNLGFSVRLVREVTE